MLFALASLCSAVAAGVGVTRFELATTRPPDAYSTGLSYTPKKVRVRVRVRARVRVWVV